MIRTYEQLIQTADAYETSKTLITAVELDLFTHLGRSSLGADALSKKTRTSREGMAFLLNALTGMGLLAKKGNRFRNSAISRRYLDTASPRSVTNFIWLAGEHWEDWIGLTDAIRRGRGRPHKEAKDDPVFRRRFSEALHERSLFLTPKVLRHLQLRGARSLMDLGGGAGSYALALLRKNLRLHATVFDRPAAVKVAQAEAKRAGYSRRLSVIGGDFFKNDYGGPYDAVLLSNVIHIYSPQKNLQILKKIRKALLPGGRLIVIDYFLNRDRTHPPDASSFALLMFLFTDTGNCYSWEEVTGWLKRYGFSRFRRAAITESIGLLEATLAGKGNS